MNRKILVTVLAMALLMMCAVPVMAATPTVSEVTATMVAAFKPGTMTYRLTEGGIFFFDAEAIGTVELDITSTGSDPDYVLNYWGTISGIINTKTDDGVLHYKVVWALKDGGEVVGTFEGVAKAKTTTYLYVSGIPHPYYSTNIYHTVLQGSGIFAGQTLRLDGTRPTLDPAVFPPVTPPNPLSWGGTLATI